MNTHATSHLRFGRSGATTVHRRHRHLARAGVILVLAGVAVGATPAIASARPDLCNMTECPPPPPRVDIDHSDIGTGGGRYPAPDYYPDVPTCADAANVVECINSGPSY
jgi:hypothetical protein